MRCNQNKTTKLVIVTAAVALTIPVVAALFIPAIYLPLLGLTVPFLAAAFLEHKVEALECAA
jgi:hypothetical protein